jgi:hypothetical protein
MGKQRRNRKKHSKKMEPALKARTKVAMKTTPYEMDGTMMTLLLDAMRCEKIVGAAWYHVATVPVATLETASARGYVNLEEDPKNGRRPRMHLTLLGFEVAKGLRGKA